MVLDLPSLPVDNLTARFGVRFTITSIFSLWLFQVVYEEGHGVNDRILLLEYYLVVVMLSYDLCRVKGETSSTGGNNRIPFKK